MFIETSAKEAFDFGQSLEGAEIAKMMSIALFSLTSK